MEDNAPITAAPADAPADAAAPADVAQPDAASADPFGFPDGATDEQQADADPFGFPKDEAEAGKQQEQKQDEAEPAVPEKYEFNLPEGLQITPELEKQFTDIARGAKLTQEQAGSLIKMHSDIILGMQEQAEQTKQSWMAECKRQGLTSRENVRAAKLTIDTFGGGAAMNALIESGAAYNPAVQKMLQNIGHLLGEDNAPDGAHAGHETSSADLLFNNSKY